MGWLSNLFHGSRINFSIIDHPPCRLGETPLWCDQKYLLYWIDIPVGNIWCYSPQTKQTYLYWCAGEPVGAIALNSDRNLLVFAVSGVYLLQERAGIFNPVQLFETDFSEGERFNDCYVDSLGRVYAGTMRPDTKQGKVLVYEKGKSPRLLIENIRISNGMAIDNDGRHFYHIDSILGCITRYTLDLDSITVTKPHIFFRAGRRGGTPDGMVMDTAGCFWVACYGGHQVIRINPQGKVIQNLWLKDIEPTSLCFGSTNLSTLYITSTTPEKNQKPYAGQVLYMEVDAVGLASNLTNF